MERNRIHLPLSMKDIGILVSTFFLVGFRLQKEVFTAAIIILTKMAA